MVTFAFPYTLEAIGWKTYMINGAWDVLELLFVLFFWFETKGKSLEEKGKVDVEDLVVEGVDISPVGEVVEVSKKVD
jgi:hypothetical protein